MGSSKDPYVRPNEWHKHFRKFTSRIYWGKSRAKSKEIIKEQINENMEINIVPTTIEAFNDKYAEYIEPGYDGLEFGNDKILAYLDEEFQELIKIPGFQYSQIKLKFGMPRVYLSTTQLLEKTKILDKSQEIEDKIEQMLK